MNGLIFTHGEQNEEEMINSINNEIEKINLKINQCDEQIKLVEEETEINKNQRMLYSSIRNINIGDVRVRFSKVSQLSKQLMDCENEYNNISAEYYQISSELQMLTKDLKTIEEAYNQYNSNVAELDSYLDKNKKYKIIAEATSPTKGKPVLAIREKVNNALSLTNRLLDVMYDGDMEMLKPVIDETHFSLPFRSGTNKLSDIRYGSQSENTLLSLAFDLSIATGLTKYNIPIIDELDAFLDAEVSESFVMMLIDIMSALQMEQLFDISHKLQPGQHDQYVHVFDITEEIR
jgi:chromosome segregation ATPase